MQIGEGDPQVATVDDEGNFSLPVEGLEEGTAITVFQEDEEGNSSEAFTTTVEAGEEDEDPTDPELLIPPTVDDVDHTDSEITGTVNPENAGYDVIVRDQDGNEIGRVTPNEDGSFTIPVEGLEPGQELEVVQVDEDGNESERARQIVTAAEGDSTDPGEDDPDPTAPTDPGDDDPTDPGEDPDDPSDTDDPTDEDESETPDPIPAPDVDDVGEGDDTISGVVADPDRPVVIEVDDDQYIVQPNPDGSFELQLDSPLEAGTRVRVYQRDADGNIGEVTEFTVGQRLPQTATNTWVVGAIGFGMIVLGFAAHTVKKFKKHEE